MIDWTIRRLTGTDEDFDAAMQHLWGSVLHQGTICPATAPVVRVVCELLAELAPVRVVELARFLHEAGVSASVMDPNENESWSAEPVTELQACGAVVVAAVLPLLTHADTGVRATAAAAVATWSALVDEATQASVAEHLADIPASADRDELAARVLALGEVRRGRMPGSQTGRSSSTERSGSACWRRCWRTNCRSPKSCRPHLRSPASPGPGP